jgi:hypothetical protein
MKGRDAREGTNEDDPKVLRVIRPPSKLELDEEILAVKKLAAWLRRTIQHPSG